MAGREAQECEVHGYKLACSICRHPRFWTRRSLLNTAAATFFNVDWANRQATNFIGERCGHILWFAPGRPS